MPVKRSKTLAILERRQQVADLYLQGWTQTAIAEHLHVAQPTVCDDLQKIRKEWRESAIRDFDETRAIELLKIDRVEREAWAAWQRSQQPAQSAVVTGEGTSKQTRRSLKHQIGDPRFLDQVSKCISQRRALLGLDAPPIEPERDPDAGLSVDLRRDRVLTIVAALSERARVTDVGTGPRTLESGDVCGDDECGEVADGPPCGLPRLGTDGVDR